MKPKFASDSTEAKAIRLVEREGLAEWTGKPGPSASWIKANEFRADLGQVLLMPRPDGSIESVIAGWGDRKSREAGRFQFSDIMAKLPGGIYKITGSIPSGESDEIALAALLSQYRFDRYNEAATDKAVLVAPDGIDAPRLESIAAAEFLTRDLINAPASDMGPEALEVMFSDLAGEFGARFSAVRGENLLRRGFPMIHAVGRASDQNPRLLELSWGRQNDPAVTLVGKGVCFDTGGLNLKPAGPMRLMKKDMGGAATAMGLAHMIMASGLPVNLRLLVPAVENSVSAGAFRPGDILRSRKGLTVEIANTDAEGRLVLADAIAYADESDTDLIVSMATLTGAARVALGPDIVPFYTSSDVLAACLEKASALVSDPIWRMPLWPPYEKMIEPGVADLANATDSGLAGSVTAAMFLARFATRTSRFLHFDIYGWQPSKAPGRPKGGVGQAARAVFEALPEVLSL
ncbi:MAG: leucyl aminopeptidase family protein [Albidovulum sp.]|nr:leucyl aminopeptidase family protein [Albidovulum sp.]